MHPDVEFKRLLVRYKDWKKQFRDRLGATQKVRITLPSEGPHECTAEQRHVRFYPRWLHEHPQHLRPS